MAASAVPRLIAVVVLPTPPFWLATANTRGRAASGRGAGKGTTSELSMGWSDIRISFKCVEWFEPAHYYDGTARTR